MTSRLALARALNDPPKRIPSASDRPNREISCGGSFAVSEARPFNVRRSTAHAQSQSCRKAIACGKSCQQLVSRISGEAR